MTFRYRKSIKLGGGVRLNLSKTGIGVSAGIPGARYSVHSSGRTTKTVGVPGTGVYYRKDTQTKNRAIPQSPYGPSPQPAVAGGPVYPKAGLMAPREEKEFVQGVTAYMQGQYERALALFQGVVSADVMNRHVGEEYFAAMCLVELNRPAEAVPLFESVMASDLPIPDGLMSKYGIGGMMEVGITPVVSVTVPMSSLAVALILAEVYQGIGQRQKAIDLLESLGAEAPNEPAFALSLADLYDEAEDYDDVVRVTDGYETNTDDVSLSILGYRAYAMTQLGLADAALAITKEGLKSKKRNGALLLMLRYTRGLAYEAAGKHAMANKEFEKVYAERSDFGDVAERLGLNTSASEASPRRPDV